MKRALVVVDMIEDFRARAARCCCGPSMGEIIPVIQRELGRARAAGRDSVVYLTDNHVPDDAEFKVAPAGGRHRRTEGAEIIPEVRSRRR